MGLAASVFSLPQGRKFHRSVMRELGQSKLAPPSPVSPLPLQELQLGMAVVVVVVVIVVDHVTSHVTNII